MTHKHEQLAAWLANTPSDARLDIRLPRPLLDAVEEYATARGWSVAFAVKFLLASREHVDADHNGKFSQSG